MGMKISQLWSLPIENMLGKVLCASEFCNEINKSM